ncbi:hypothetical protein DYB37_000329, partial [Aphanomyces astaci]
KLRGLWHHYYKNTDAVIFVVDSNDGTLRLQQASDELHHMFQEIELQNAKLLVYANKQDLPGAMTTSDIADKMQVESVTSHGYYIQPCIALTGKGLYEGLEWLSKELV